MKEEAASPWRRPLPLFIRMVGWLVMLYAGFLVMGSAMAAWNVRHIALHGLMVWPFRISLLVVLLVSVLMFFSGRRMARPADQRGRAEFSSLMALLAARLVDLGSGLKLQPGFGSLAALAAAILVYLVVRSRLQVWLKRMVPDEA